MIRILCYGDSNTWGFNPKTYELGLDYYLRYDKTVRWTGRLQNLLGDDFTVIEEGLNGRTTCMDDCMNPQDLNGRKYLMPCLGTCAPVDLIVIMLGTNDLKSRFHVTAYDIAAGVEMLVHIVEHTNFGPEGSVPKILLVSPVLLDERLNRSFITDLFDVFEAEKNSRILPPLIKEMADKHGCEYLNCNDYAELSHVDYVHFTAKGHERLAEGLHKKIIDMFGES